MENSNLISLQSPSLRGSGLKSGEYGEETPTDIVSLFTREWIEIFSMSFASTSLKSPSLRGSGLKYVYERNYADMELSPSLRGSGLK